MAKFAEANKRMYKNVFVCRRCKTKKKADPSKVRRGKVSCRNCYSKALRPVRKK
ncbi:MAG TPA: hypothetical protein VJI68_00595 [Candidatus Nanoarchaeia archaeon]|nr:hypothetical protein [Candidatus Nanoarchaeia archaeon]